MNTDRYDNNIGIANNGSVEADQSLQLNAGNEEKIADDAEKNYINNFSQIDVLFNIQLENLKESYSMLVRRFTLRQS